MVFVQHLIRIMVVSVHEFASVHCTITCNYFSCIFREFRFVITQIICTEVSFYKKPLLCTVVLFTEILSETDFLVSDAHLSLPIMCSSFVII